MAVRVGPWLSARLCEHRSADWGFLTRVILYRIFWNSLELSNEHSRSGIPRAVLKFPIFVRIPDLRNDVRTVPPTKTTNAPPPPSLKNIMNNNNDNDKTTSNSFDNSSSGFPIAEAVLSKPAQQQHQFGTSSALYKLAARNLREYHGVSSMTALKLEETVTLLGLRPRRLVARGLAPRRLLKDSFSPLVLTGDSSDEGQQELCEAETSLLMDASGDKVITNNTNSSSSKDAEENGEEDSSSTHVDDGDSIDNINLHIDDNEVEDAKGVVKGFKGGKKKRPIHAALVAGGVDLLPRETRPLLRALGVSPHRLVKLGLVNREAIHAIPGRRGGSTGPGQHLRAGGHGKRGVGRPRGSPNGPGRRLFHGAGNHALHRGEHSEGEGMPSRPGPHGGPQQRGLRHPGGRLQGPLGPGHHSMPTFGHRPGAPGGGKHGHGHRHLPRGHGRRHGHPAGVLQRRGEGKGGECLRGGRAGGPGQHGPRRHGGGMGRPRGPPHGPHDAHGGPQHRGPPRHGGGAEGRSPDRPQGPPRGPPRGHFHRLFHQPGLEAY